LFRHGANIQLTREIKSFYSTTIRRYRQIKLAFAATMGKYFPLTLTIKFMADVANKYTDNITGTYYVDNQCIDCDLCRETAPDNFKRNDDGGYSFVYKQPENDTETARCKEAKEGCPVEAIGDNGA
jgi:ferredoxin